MILMHVIAMIVVIVIVRAADHASAADEADYKQDRSPTDAFACVGHFVSKSVLPRTEFIAMQSMSQLTRRNRAGDRGRSFLPLAPRFPGWKPRQSVSTGDTGNTCLGSLHRAGGSAVNLLFSARGPR